jgi:hypothetical protein
VALDPIICAVGDELHGGELASVIGVQHLELEAALLFYSSLYMLNGVRGCRLRWKKDGPHEPRSIIHQQQEVASTSWCHRRDGAAEVTVDELELLQRTVRNLSRKRPLLVLGHHACVTQLRDVVDLRHPTHHLLAPEILERLEVEMPEPFMPTPGLIVSMSGEAEGPDHLHVKHAQPVAPAVDLGEKRPRWSQIRSTHRSISTLEPPLSSWLRLMMEF